MLEVRDDLCVLWDIRVTEEYKHKGIGQGICNLLYWREENELKWITTIGLAVKRIN